MNKKQGVILKKKVSKDAVLEAIVSLDTKVTGIGEHVSVLDERFQVLDGRVSVIGENLSALDGRVSVIGKNLSTLDKRVSVIGGNLSTLTEHVSALGENLTEQIQEIRDELRTNFATKADLVELEERLTGEMRAISRAVDTDAVTIINHERRISKIEKTLVLK